MRPRYERVRCQSKKIASRESTPLRRADRENLRRRRGQRATRNRASACKSRATLHRNPWKAQRLAIARMLAHGARSGRRQKTSRRCCVRARVPRPRAALREPPRTDLLHLKARSCERLTQTMQRAPICCCAPKLNQLRGSLRHGRCAQRARAWRRRRRRRRQRRKTRQNVAVRARARRRKRALRVASGDRWRGHVTTTIYEHPNRDRQFLLATLKTRRLVLIITLHVASSPSSPSPSAFASAVERERERARATWRPLSRSGDCTTSARASRLARDDSKKALAITVAKMPNLETRVEASGAIAAEKQCE